MPDPDKTVFLSYRREVSWAMAHLVRNDLVAHGFDVFMDVHGLNSGEFERVILREIETRTHFLVLLEPRSTDRIAEEGDWLRREIAYALLHRRNVVPVTANGARVPRAADLPADVARLSSFNAVSVPHDYFVEAMQKLRGRFLRLPVAEASSPYSTDVGPYAEPRRLEQPSPPRPALTAVVGPVIAVLRWTQIDGARGYDLQRSDSPAYGASIVHYCHGTANYAIEMRAGLPAGGWFRVRAVRGQRSPHDPWSNVVNVPPSPPSTDALVPPRLIAIGKRSAVLLAWTSISGAERYVLQEVPGPGEGAGGEIFRGSALHHRHVVPASLMSHYRVRAEMPGGRLGPWSEPTLARDDTV